MGMIQKFLGDIFNLFPLGGSTGGIVVRQKGGTAGANELQVYYGSNSVTFSNPGRGTIVLDSAGNVVMGEVLTTALDVGSAFSNAGGVGRIVSGVTGPRTNAAAGGWFQNTDGRSRVTTADVTNTSTTFAAITGLTATLIAGRKYSGWVALKVNSATAADGIKFDFNGGTATMTNFWAAMYPIAGAPATKGVDLSTALNTALTFTAMGDTNDAVVLFSVNLVCNAAGTFIPEFALNSGTGTATIRVSSAMWLDDIP